MPIKGPTYKKGEKISYNSFGKTCEAKILGAHLDDLLEPYYTIQLPDGREKQTDDAHLSPLGSMPQPQQAPPVYQPSAPMPNYPPPPPPRQVTPPSNASRKQQPSIATNKPAPRKEQHLPKPQDEPWDMTGRAQPSKPQKKQPPKPDPSRSRRLQTKKPFPSSSTNDYPWDEKPQTSTTRRVTKPSSTFQSVEAKRRQQQQQQQRRRQNASQYDPYSRRYQQTHQHSPHNPFGSMFAGGGMPIRSRL